MTDILSAPPAVSKHSPWNKARSSAQSRPPVRSTSGQSEPSSKSKAECAIWRCSTSTASCAGCDVVALKVDDLAPGGHAADRATVRQKKTGAPSNSN